jgi:hypothetical protein
MLAEPRRPLKAGTVPEGRVNELLWPVVHLSLGERSQLDDLHAPRKRAGEGAQGEDP